MRPMKLPARRRTGAPATNTAAAMLLAAALGLPATARDLRPLLGGDCRSARRPHRQRVEQHAQVRRVDNAYRSAVGGHDCRLGRRRGRRQRPQAERAGELQVHGSGALVRWLLENHLVDEITLFAYPVVVGQGTRLFPDIRRDTALDLVLSRAFPNGITIQVHRPTGRRSTPRDCPEPAGVSGSASQPSSLAGTRSTHACATGRWVSGEIA